MQTIFSPRLSKQFWLGPFFRESQLISLIHIVVGSVYKWLTIVKFLTDLDTTGTQPRGPADNTDEMNVEPKNSRPAPGTQAAAFEMLMNAIGSLLSPVIQQLLSSDPGLVHFKGWHGMTPLHRACLMGDYNIVLMFIQANSDVNALTDFNETPLHYASKRGMPNVVHLLIQCGAQADLRDSRGRSAFHHAAETGALQVMKYFEETFGVNTRELDSNLQSPMHLACLQGHLDLFMFLMKKGRSDLRQADSQGNLPIHITAKNGFGFMTWSMMCILGVPSLRQTNKAGFTPVDLVLQGDKFGHRELAPVLKYYARQPDHVQVTGPIYTWYTILLYPFVLYSVTVLISQCFTTYQFVIYIVALVVMAMLNRKLDHRMHDVSRWPNPFFAGVFAAGILHTTICYLWLMYPNFYTTLWIATLTLTVCPALYIVYYIIIKNDPGSLMSSAKDPETGKLLTMVDLCMMRDPPYNYCGVCDLVTTKLTKHCKLCDQCYLYLDHHCLFLLKCVATNNHVLFVWLLILACANMCFYCLAFYLYVTFIYPDLVITSMLYQIVHEQAWPFTILALNVGSAVWSLNLIHMQYGVVTRGCTFYFNEFEARQYKMTRKQTIVNFIHFLCNKPLPYQNPHSPLLAKPHPTPHKLRDIKPSQVRTKSEIPDIEVV